MYRPRRSEDGLRDRVWYPGQGYLNPDLVREYGIEYYDDKEHWELMAEMSKEEADRLRRKLRQQEREHRRKAHRLYEQIGRLTCERKPEGRVASRAAGLRGKATIEPRVMRLKDAPAYCGMDKNRFNIEARPYLIVVPIGKRGIGFDRVDLDRWLEEYKARNGRPGEAMEGGSSWGRKSRQDLLEGVKSGISKKQSEKREFEKALERATLRKPNGI